MTEKLNDLEKMMLDLANSITTSSNEWEVIRDAMFKSFKLGQDAKLDVKIKLVQDCIKCEQKIRAEAFKDVIKMIEDIIEEAVNYKEAMKIQNNCQIEGSNWKEVDINELNIQLAGMRELLNELKLKWKNY